MDRTRVIVELLPDDNSADKLLAGLNKSFDEVCPDLGCSLVRKRNFQTEKTIVNGMSVALRLATNVLLVEEDVTTCLYVAPRRLEFIAPGKSVMPINGVILAVASEKKPIGLFIQTITAKQVPAAITHTLNVHLTAARSRLLYPSNSLQQETRDRLVEAVQHGYSLAFS